MGLEHPLAFPVHEGPKAGIVVNGPEKEMVFQHIGWKPGRSAQEAFKNLQGLINFSKLGMHRSKVEEEEVTPDSIPVSGHDVDCPPCLRQGSCPNRS
jgi:hypothetical protein